MQYCSKCRVFIENPHERCPLCQGKLEGEAKEEEKLFPDLTEQKNRLFLGFRMFTFCCIALIVLGLAVNVMSVSYTHLEKYADYYGFCKER